MLKHKGDLLVERDLMVGRRLTTTLAVNMPNWSTAKNYIIGDVIIQNNIQYSCLVSHTSGVFATDLGNVNWVALSSSSSGSGTVTSVGFTNANGFTGTIATPTTTPTLTLGTSVTGLLKGNGTAISAAVAGTDYVVPNAAITAGTGTKITYDAKGLVTSSTNATATDIVNTPSGNLAGTTVQVALNELQGDVDTINTNITALVTLSGVVAGSTNLGTFTGSTIADNLTEKAALQSIETAIEGKLTSITPQVDGVTSTQFVQTLAADGISKTSTLNIKSMIGSNGTIAGQSGLVPTPAIADNTKFLRGDGTWAVTSGGGITGISVQEEGTLLGTASTVDTINIVGTGTTATRSGNTVTITSVNSFKYVLSSVTGSAGITCRVKGTPGITLAKTTASIFTFTIPAGGYIDNHEVFFPAGENPAATLTFVYNYTSNTITNQGTSTLDAPTYTGWFSSAVPIDIYHSRAIGSASDIYQQVIAVGSGNFTTQLELNSTGLSSGDIIIKAKF